MIDTTTTAYELTRQDIRALRTADSVSFGVYQWRGYVRARIHGENSSTGWEQTHEILADFSLSDYGNDGFLTTDGFEAFHMIGTAKFSDLWPSIMRRITPGCSLSLAWVRGNDNDHLRDAGFHADELRLIIRRNGKEERYLVGYQVGPDNSARMTRKPR